MIQYLGQNVRIERAHLAALDRVAIGARAELEALAIHSDTATVTLRLSDYLAASRRWRVPPKQSKLGHLWADIRTWLKAGAGRVGPMEYARRRTICGACPYWGGNRWWGSGVCRLCGCSTAARLRLAGVRCPDTPPRW